jgi:hypothetical protein
MTEPRPTIYRIPPRKLPERPPKEKDQRLWKKRKDSLVQK